MNLKITDDSGTEYWSATQCAEHCGISRDTFTAYAYRKQAPTSVTKWQGLTLWNADEVRHWNANRPSRS